MPAWRKSTLLLLLIACVAGAADLTLLSHVMPEAKVISGANLSQFLISPLGRFLLSQVQTAEPRLQSFIQTTGFDPLRDLNEVLIASPANPKENRGVLLVRGVFDPSRIAEFAKQSGAVIQPYKGVQVMRGKQKRDGWLAFLDSSTAVAGDPRSVQDVIDRGGSGPGPDPKLLAKINQVSSMYDFWAVSVAPASDLARPVPDAQLNGVMQGDVLRGIVETSGGIKFGPNFLIGGEAVTRSDKDATALADVVRFFVGMAQMSAQKDPKAAASLALLQRLNLKAEGNTVTLSLTVPEADLEKIIQYAQAMAKQQAAAAAKPSNTVNRQPPPRPAGEVVVDSSPKEMGTVVIE